MHYVYTLGGTMLEAVTIAVLQFFGETHTSEAVFKVATVISVLLVIAGVFMAIMEESKEEIAEVLLKHAAIIVVGGVLCWLLSWSLIIGLGGIAVLFMFFVIWLTM